MTKTDTTSISGEAAATTGENATARCWLLKTAKAPKLGKNAEGGIHYQIVTDSQRQDPMFKIVGNEGGGYYSKEVVAFRDVEACFAEQPKDQPFPSKLLQAVFKGRSSNNAGFLAAILRAEGLLALALDTEGRHITAGDWASWKASVLAQTGEPIETEASDTQEKTEDQDDPAPSDEGKKGASKREKK